MFIVPVGITEQERAQKNRVRVDISVTIDASEAAEKDDLNFTTDYAEFYKIAAKHFTKEYNLLETYLREIKNELVSKYPNGKAFYVKLTKLNPPGLENTEGSFVEWVTPEK